MPPVSRVNCSAAQAPLATMPGVVTLRSVAFRPRLNREGPASVGGSGEVDARDVADVVGPCGVGRVVAKLGRGLGRVSRGAVAVLGGQAHRCSRSGPGRCWNRRRHCRPNNRWPPSRCCPSHCPTRSSASSQSGCPPARPPDSAMSVPERRKPSTPGWWLNRRSWSRRNQGWLDRPPGRWPGCNSRW